MSITTPTDAQMLERFAQQRLREVVTRHRPMLDAAAAAVETAIASGRIDAREGRRLLDRFEIDLRDRATQEAEAIIEFRVKIIEGEPGIGTVPNDIAVTLAGMNREKRAYLDELAKEIDWLDAAVEYGMERTRCIHEGDIMPDRRDFGLPVESVSSDDE